MKIRSSLVLLVLVASLVLSACATAPATPAAEPAAAAAEEAAAEEAAATEAPAEEASATEESAEAATEAPAEEAAATEAPAEEAAATEVPAEEAAADASSTEDFRTSDSGYEGVLNYWVLGFTPGNQFATPMETAVAAFEAANPGIDVEIVGYPPNDEGFTALNIAVQTGQGVDVLRLPSDRLLGFVAEGLIAPAEDYMSESDLADFYPAVLDTVRLQDNKAMAWPLWVVPMGMYLNTDVFAERGVELPSKEWTWEEFVEVGKQLTFTRDNGEEVYGFAGFVDPGVINTWSLFMNEDPSVRPVVDGEFGFDSPEAIAGIQRYADMALVDKITPPDFGALADADVKGGFTNGQFAMVIDATGPAAQFKADGVNYEIYPVPTIGDNDPVTAGAVGLIAVVQQDDEASCRSRHGSCPLPDQRRRARGCADYREHPGRLLPGSGRTRFGCGCAAARSVHPLPALHVRDTDSGELVGFDPYHPPGAAECHLRRGNCRGSHDGDRA